MANSIQELIAHLLSQWVLGDLQTHEIEDLLGGKSKTPRNDETMAAEPYVWLVRGRERLVARLSKARQEWFDEMMAHRVAQYAEGIQPHSEDDPLFNRRVYNLLQFALRLPSSVELYAAFCNVRTRNLLIGGRHNNVPLAVLLEQAIQHHEPKE